MIETKNTIKELGKKMRESNAAHQDVLRSQLHDRMQDKEVTTHYSFLKPMMFSTATIFALIIVVVLAKPEPPVAYTSAPPTGLVREESPTDVLFDSDSFATESSVGGAGFGMVTGLTTSFVQPAQPEQKRDVYEYEQEHGQMLETSSAINLMTREKDPLAKTESLFSSLGGHISSIYDYGMGQPATVTGFVPADSYFLFREQLRELVKADRFMLETINAQDLIPSAISIDEHIADVKAQIEKTTDEATKARLETQLKNLTESRESLDGRVEFVTVSVTIVESTGVWGATDRYELEQAITGYEEPNFLTQAWVNVLMVIFWMIQAFSVTFWLVIPIGIWLLVRRKNRRVMRELD